MAILASYAFTSDDEAPSGNPITVHTFTSGVSFNTSCAVFTHAGFTHTEANLYSFASCANLTISSCVAFAFSNV